MGAILKQKKPDERYRDIFLKSEKPRPMSGEAAGFSGLDRRTDMGLYRAALPQLAGDLFLTDGGIETTLIFHDGLDLPFFAAFDLLQRENGREALRRYYRGHAAIAAAHGVGFILESATWRASADWGAKLGYSRPELAAANREAVRMLEEIRDEYARNGTRMVISGCVGPRGDGYDPAFVMSEGEAQRYHAEQVDVFTTTAADMVTAITMTNIPEAIGVTRAAQAAGMPVVISFTVETDGCLPTGDSFKDAIERVDAATGGGPAYYMINCAHPTHFEDALSSREPWIRRLRGLRANASTRSHAELDEAAELDDGNPVELGAQYRSLMERLPHLAVLGGCCGTDQRHIAAITSACIRRRAA
jgi:S-methylmethionine-dependent homocysteine/selenocysteine methylase